MEPLKIGLVGCGRIASGMHLPQYPRIPEARLIAFFDEEHGRAAQMRDSYAALLERRAEEQAGAGDRADADRLRENASFLIAHEGFDSFLEAVDAVDVCVPPRWHVSLALKALAAGRSAMSEKPMARSWLDAQRVAMAAKPAGVIYRNYSGPWCYEVAGIGGVPASAPRREGKTGSPCFRGVEM
jgi:predicted dehydrogenase